MCYSHLATVLLLILDPIAEVEKSEEAEDDDVAKLVRSKINPVTKGNTRYKYWKEFNPIAKEYLRNLSLVISFLLLYVYTANFF